MVLTQQRLVDPPAELVEERLSGTPLAAGHARNVIIAACSRWGIDPGGEVACRAVLIVSELVTNAVQHTRSADVRLWLWRFPTRLLVEVGDHGSNPDLVQLRAPDPNNELGEMGRGLWLVNHLARETGGSWGSRWDPSGVVVWAQIPLADADTAAHS